MSIKGLEEFQRVSTAAISDHEARLRVAEEQMKAIVRIESKIDRNLALQLGGLHKVLDDDHTC